MSEHATIPLGDLIFDLIHAVALNDEIETLEAALALAKAAESKIEDRTLDGSPSVALKLRRMRKRLKQDLGDKGLAPDAPKAKRKAKATAPVSSGLDWTPTDDDRDDDEDEDD